MSTTVSRWAGDTAEGGPHTVAAPGAAAGRTRTDTGRIRGQNSRPTETHRDIPVTQTQSQNLHSLQSLLVLMYLMVDMGHA